MQLDAVPKLGRTKFEGLQHFLSLRFAVLASVRLELTYASLPRYYQKLPCPKGFAQKRSMERAHDGDEQRPSQ